MLQSRFIKIVSTGVFVLLYNNDVNTRQVRTYVLNKKKMKDTEPVFLALFCGTIDYPRSLCLWNLIIV